MSWEASAWAMRQQLRATNKMVLIVLANCHNDLRDNQCNPSTKYIAEHGGMSQASVNRAIAFLAKEGYITIEHKHRADGSLSSSQYILHLTGGTITQTLGAITVIDQEPVIESGNAPVVPSDSDESSGAVGGPKKRKSSKTKPPSEVTEVFRQRMREKHSKDPVVVDDQIDRAMNHTASKKAIDIERYIQNWLNDAVRWAKEKTNATNQQAPLPGGDSAAEDRVQAFYERKRARGERVPDLPGS